MRIPEGLIGETVAAQVRKPEAQEAVAGQGDRKAAGQARGDETRWSQFSDRLRAAAAADPPGHAERLARLAADYAAGRYRVDSGALSRKLVEGALAGG